MNKFWIILFAVTICSSLMSAQELSNSLLWKVSGNELKSSSYLFGTLHATCKTELKPKVTNALNATNQLVLEIDMSDPTIQMTVAKSMFLTNDQLITDFLNEEETEILKNFLSSKIEMMNFEMLQRIKPFFLSSLLIPTMLDCPIPNAYDTMLLQKAKASNMKIIGLETIEDQLAIFDKIPLDVQIIELVKTAKDNMQEDTEEFDLMVLLYEEEKINELAKMMTENESYFSSNSDLLLDNRNLKWIPQIEASMKNQSSFIGFGAMHLVGKNGVIQLLRQKGYTVEAVFE